MVARSPKRARNVFARPWWSSMAITRTSRRSNAAVITPSPAPTSRTVEPGSRSASSTSCSAHAGSSWCQPHCLRAEAESDGLRGETTAAHHAATDTHGAIPARGQIRRRAGFSRSTMAAARWRARSPRRRNRCGSSAGLFSSICLSLLLMSVSNSSNLCISCISVPPVCSSSSYDLFSIS